MSAILGVWAAPIGPKAIQKGGGPPVWMVLGQPGAAKHPKTDDIQKAQNSQKIKNGAEQRQGLACRRG